MCTSQSYAIDTDVSTGFILAALNTKRREALFWVAGELLALDEGNVEVSDGDGTSMGVFAVEGTRKSERPQFHSAHLTTSCVQDEKFRFCVPLL